MKTFCVRGRSLPEAYHKAIFSLAMTKEKECTMLINVKEPFAEPMISKLGIYTPKDLEQYRQEVCDGILDFEVERGNWDYTYHQRLVKWKEEVLRDLKRDAFSRRAVIAVRDNAKDFASGDPACLQSLQYMIRDGKLHCWANMRSNDAVQASFMNMFGFVMLQKEFADKMGLSVGEYTHYATNYHAEPKRHDLLISYAKKIHREMVKTHRNRIAERLGEPCEKPEYLAYNFVGCWDEMMKDARPEIAAQVQEQYGKYLAEKICCANCGRDCNVKLTEGDRNELSCFEFLPKE